MKMTWDQFEDRLVSAGFIVVLGLVTSVLVAATIKLIIQMFSGA